MRRAILLLLAVDSDARSTCMRGRQKPDGRYFPKARGHADFFSLSSAINGSLATLEDALELSLRQPLLMPRVLQVERMVAQTMDCELFMFRIFMSILRRECIHSAHEASRCALTSRTI